LNHPSSDYKKGSFMSESERKSFIICDRATEIYKYLCGQG
jgi:hypothetical protein